MDVQYGGGGNPPPGAGVGEEEGPEVLRDVACLAEVRRQLLEGSAAAAAI